MASMRGTSWWITVASAMALVGACGAGDIRVDPGDLELRDLLGLSPDVANEWDGEQRAAARLVLVGGFHENAEPASVTLDAMPSLDDRVVRGLAVVDANRIADGASALGVVRIVLRATELSANPRPAARAIGAAEGGAHPSSDPATELWLAEQWDTRAWSHLPGRGLELLSAMALDAGHDHGPVIVVPAPRLAAISGYVAADGAAPARLIVNPIVLAALEPEPMEAATAALLERAALDGTPHARIAPKDPTTGVAPVETAAVASGNPYSFYGSIAECAYVQRTRCESCLPAGTCTAVTSATGNDECTALGATNGRGYFLLCANLAIAISSVERCTAESAPGCARDLDAASELNELENNANFIDDPTCGSALDACLSEIYGAPGGAFPGPGPDAGVVDPPRPPRSTSIDCGDSCSNNNSNCEASPNCNCDGPSCNNALSCDSACSSSNDQGGCGGNCDSCSSDDSTTGGGGSCSSQDGSGTGGGTCSGDSGGGSSGGSCGGGGCGGGGGCSGGGCGGSSGGGGCNNGGSSGSCNVTRRDSSGGIALAISLMWAFMPVPVAAVIRTRSRRKRKLDHVSTEEVAS